MTLWEKFQADLDHIRLLHQLGLDQNRTTCMVIDLLADLSVLSFSCDHVFDKQVWIDNQWLFQCNNCGQF